MGVLWLFKPMELAESVFGTCFLALQAMLVALEEAGSASMVPDIVILTIYRRKFPSLANLVGDQICNSVSFSNFEKRLDRFVPLLKRSRLVKKSGIFRQNWGSSYPCTKVAATK